MALTAAFEKGKSPRFPVLMDGKDSAGPGLSLARLYQISIIGEQ